MRFYQTLERRVIKPEDKEALEEVKNGLKSEMPSENSEAGAMGSKGLSIPGLENEPDLYEDLI